MNRKLASVQVIEDIQPIEGYDRVELARVLGWTLIIGKNSFDVGDKCVFFEPDSLLYPHVIWDEFLAKRKYRIKTQKMCKAISQGLALPVDTVKQLTGKTLELEVGMDLTDILKVQHYEVIKGQGGTKSGGKPDHPLVKFLMQFKLFRSVRKVLFPKKSSGFPTDFITKTDETNIQAIPHILRATKNEKFYITEKVEGQSATYLIRPSGNIFGLIAEEKDFIVCSHNMRRFSEDQSNWWNVARTHAIREKLIHYHNKNNVHLAIQGEIVGPNDSRGNIYGLKALELYVFRIKDLTNDIFLDANSMEDCCDKLGLKFVPIVQWDVNLMNETVDSLLEMSNGFSLINSKTKREGLVVRTMDMKVSFKVKSPDYLLTAKEIKYEENADGSSKEVC